MPFHNGNSEQAWREHYSGRSTRAVEDQSAPIPEEITSELGRIIYIVRRAQLRLNEPAPSGEVASELGGERGGG